MGHGHQHAPASTSEPAVEAPRGTQSTRAAAGNQATAERLGLNSPRGGESGGTGSETAAQGWVRRVKALPGWSALSADDQAKLEALLGGETNELSASARRAAMRLVVDPAFTQKSAAEQAVALAALISSPDAAPSVGAEPNRAPAAPYTLNGPTVEKDHQFAGKKADANVWALRIADKQDVTIYTPVTPEAGQNYHTAQQAAEALARVPEASRRLVRTVTIHPSPNPQDAFWAQQYRDPTFQSYMTAGASGDVSIYPLRGALPTQDYMAGTMIHETGHTWSYQTWGNDTNQGGWLRWKAAMTSDRASVSGYAQKAIAEDVAETVQVYGSTRGAPAFEEYRRIVPARFAILDAELK